MDSVTVFSPTRHLGQERGREEGRKEKGRKEKGEEKRKEKPVTDKRLDEAV